MNLAVIALVVLGQASLAGGGEKQLYNGAKLISGSLTVDSGLTAESGYKFTLRNQGAGLKGLYIDVNTNENALAIDDNTNIRMNGPSSGVRFYYSDSAARWYLTGGAGTAALQVPSVEFASHGDLTGSPGTSGTSNTPAGKACLSTAGAAFTLTNSMVTASTKVFITPLDIDTNVAKWKVAPGSGSVVVTVDATPAANWCFEWFVAR